MHIAICTENAASRKHLERLLNREGNLFTKEEPIYVDSYGNLTALFAQPLLYDLYLLEAASQTAYSESITLVKSVRERFLHANIAVLLQPDLSDDFLSSISDLGESVSLLTVPVNHDSLQALIHQFIEQKKQAEPVFEIRGRLNTIYIHSDEFAFGQDHGKRQSLVTLQDGRQIDFFDSLKNLTGTMNNHPSLFAVGTHYLVNTRYIKSCHLFSLTMQNGVKIPASLLETRYIRKLMSKLLR